MNTSSYSKTDHITIQNDGDEIGFTIRIEVAAGEAVPEIAAYMPTIYNADTGEYLQIKGEVRKGDVITITTKTGNKTITLTRNGVDSNMINRLVAGSAWLSLREGRNTFHVQAVRGVKNLKVTLIHRNAYLGV
ncbi:MAG: phage tail family protein [Oscillospiraceae bacterium]|nr:phage tail family protein [Oscillospiraceae bacterium]